MYDYKENLREKHLYLMNQNLQLNYLYDHWSSLKLTNRDFKSHNYLGYKSYSSTTFCNTYFELSIRRKEQEKHEKGKIYMSIRSVYLKDPLFSPLDSSFSTELLLILAFNHYV